MEGVAGVQVMTTKTFAFAEERSLPLMFFINKLERERASFDRCLGEIQERYGRTAVPLQLPVGVEEGAQRPAGAQRKRERWTPAVDALLDHGDDVPQQHRLVGPQFVRLTDRRANGRAD